MRERHMSQRVDRIIDRCQSVTSPLYTILGDETENLAVKARPVSGEYAIEFDKADATETTKSAGAYREYDPPLDLDGDRLGGGYITWKLYVSSVADIDYAWIRLGEDSSNYNEYRFPDSRIEPGRYTFCSVPLWDFTLKGTGCDFAGVDYMAWGVAFDGEDDALADMCVAEISIWPGIAPLPTIPEDIVDFTTQDGAGSAVDSPKTSVGTTPVSLTAPAHTRFVTLQGEAAIRVGRNGTLDGTADEGYDQLMAYEKEAYPIRPGQLIYFRIDAASGTTSVNFKFLTTE
jgi:hypothetical protein